MDQDGVVMQFAATMGALSSLESFSVVMGKHDARS
jgi:hypothetical protein